MSKILGILVVGGLFCIGCHKNTQATASEASSVSGVVKAVSDEKENKPIIDIKDLEEGKGDFAEKDDLLLVEYTGSLPNGKEFDSNKKPGRGPFAFYIGQGYVIQGWDQGLLGMKKGGFRKLVIPSDLAYGDAGIPDVIPPKSELHFDVKLLELVKKDKLEALGIEVVTPGKGFEAKKGNTVKVHYTGKLVNGQKFDSSLDRGVPFEFELGAGRVIKGWDQGIQGMKIGEKRVLTIPPALGYGERGAGGAIGSNQVLIFEVELLGVK